MKFVKNLLYVTMIIIMIFCFISGMTQTFAQIEEESSTPIEVIIPEPTIEPTIEPTPELTIQPTSELEPEPEIIIETTPEPLDEEIINSTPEPAISPIIEDSAEPTPKPTPDLSNVRVNIWLDEKRSVYMVGESITLLSEVTNYDGPVIYQWFIKTREAKDWSIMEGETNPNLTIVLDEYSFTCIYRLMATIDAAYLR